jgi:hypothetical protein
MFNISEQNLKKDGAIMYKNCDVYSLWYKIIKSMSQV